MMCDLGIYLHIPSLQILRFFVDFIIVLQFSLSFVYTLVHPFKFQSIIELVEPV